MDSFLYCWVDYGKSMLYIGKHKGSDNDGYVCSSKLMNEQYSQRRADFQRIILVRGDHVDIARWETEILTVLDAAKSKQFYNQTNGHGVEFVCKGHTEETIRKMRRPKSEKHKSNLRKPHNGIPWNKGKTKETDATMASIAEQNRISQTGYKYSVGYNKNNKHAQKIGVST